MSTEVGQTILRQLGGQRFITMTGARDFVGSDDNLRMRLPSRSGNKVNIVNIVLTANDTYTVEGFNLRGVKLTSIAKKECVYVDNLRQIFTSMTGLDTSL